MCIRDRVRARAKANALKPTVDAACAWPPFTARTGARTLPKGRETSSHPLQRQDIVPAPRTARRSQPAPRTARRSQPAPRTARRSQPQLLCCPSSWCHHRRWAGTERPVSGKRWNDASLAPGLYRVHMPGVGAVIHTGTVCFLQFHCNCLSSPCTRAHVYIPVSHLSVYSMQFSAIRTTGMLYITLWFKVEYLQKRRRLMVVVTVHSCLSCLPPSLPCRLGLLYSTFGTAAAAVLAVQSASTWR